jgi:DNA primase
MEDVKLFLLGELENVLGSSTKKSKTNYAFHCPFCNHPKPKLEVDVETNSKGENPFACWVCGTKGRTVKKLLQLLRLPKTESLQVLQFVKKGSAYEEVDIPPVMLPKESKPLLRASKESVLANKARNYLNKRGISDTDIRKYNIGYAVDGEYRDRIIIPSYSENGQLNYFITRTIGEAFQKYKIPPIASKDIIFFESLINWNEPVTLCEGVFDAIAIKRNAIPLLGKFIQPALKKRLLQSDVQEIYIALDSDAQVQAYKHCEELIRMGKQVHIVQLEGKDPSEVGFRKFLEFYNKAVAVDFMTLLQYKLAGI